MTKQLRIGSLFAGIGGLELGLERSGLGHVVWQVEIDAACRRVLAKHWPDAKRYMDVREVGSGSYGARPDKVLSPVEVICGGFPCQDLSDASRGRGGGILGLRSGLWRQYIRVVSELLPRIVIVENVGGAAAKAWVPALRRSLHLHGYRTRALRVDARDVGAPHRRSRVFVVGYADTQAQPTRAEHEEMARLRTPSSLGGHWRQPLPRTLRMANGVPGGLDPARLEQLGNAVVPDMAELIGRVVIHDINHERILA